MSKPKTTYDPIKKLFYGRRTPIKYGPDYSIGRAIIEALQAESEHIAQICYHNGRQFTNREILTLSIRVAQHFEEMGLPQCAVIGICAANSDYVAPLFYGAMLAGLTVSTLDPSFEKDGIRHTVSMTEPKLMFCDGSIYKKVNEALKEARLDCKIYTVHQHLAGVSDIIEFLAETGKETNYKPQTLQHGIDQTAMIICSSGTTGLPKGVCVSHASLLNCTSRERTKDDIMLSFGTLCVLSGVRALIVGTLNYSTRILTTNAFSPEEMFNIIEKYQVTSVFTIPSQIAISLASSKIKTANLSSLRMFLTGGTVIPRSVVEALQSYKPNAQLMVGYGMSEVGGAISRGVWDESCSNGQLMNNMEMKIINSEGQSLGPGEVGEICLRTSFKWPGYYNNPKATAEMFDNEGWLHSGDLGYVSCEGNVYVLERIAEVFYYKNERVYPAEIEHLLIELPGVLEVCVCGLPDEVSDFLPTAAIVRSKISDLTESTVLEHVAKNMDHFKQLHGGVYFVDSLPKAVTGKCVRRYVVEICQKLRNKGAM